MKWSSSLTWLVLASPEAKWHLRYQYHIPNLPLLSHQKATCEQDPHFLHAACFQEAEYGILCSLDVTRRSAYRDMEFGCLLFVERHEGVAWHGLMRLFSRDNIGFHQT
jgi:hypothetical protein